MKKGFTIHTLYIHPLSLVSYNKSIPTMSSLHACEIQVTFPTNRQAEQALQILQVDAEPTDRVSKSFRLEQRKDVTSMIV